MGKTSPKSTKPDESIRFTWIKQYFLILVMFAFKLGALLARGVVFESSSAHFGQGLEC
jgi:hypothetical protein